MMKSRKPLLTLLATGSFVFASALMAQDQSGAVPPPPPPPAPQAATSPPPPPMPPGARETPTGQAGPMNTPQGELTIKSSMAPASNFGPPPDFATLSGGGKSISEAQAAAYPPLANDFIHADRNRDGHITKAEYEAWARH